MKPIEHALVSPVAPLRPAAPRRAAPALACLLVLAVAACATQPPPGVSPDLLAARASADPAHALDLLRQQGERFAHVPFLPGNQTKLLINGPTAFAALAEAIRGARTRIDMETYEFDKQAGGQFATLLAEARQRGVEVNLIYDAWGSSDTPSEIFTQLRQAGVRVLEYNPLAPNSRVPIDLNARDHRKLLCVDGALAITGGVNISRVYENAPTPAARQAAARPDAAPKATTDDPNDEAWRDTDVRIVGPVTAQFETYFMQTWRAQHGPPLAPPPAAPAPAPGGVLVQAIDGAPDNGKPLIYRTLLAAMALSQHSVHLTTGFFVPTPDMVRGLQEAARRGVDVDVIVPGRSTSSMALAGGRASYQDLLDAGVKIHEFQGRVLHAKTAVIDGAWTAIGSSNLDWRSTVWNNEIDAIILSPAFGGEMEQVFVADIAVSKTIEPAQWARRGLAERLAELRARIMAKLL